MEWINVWIGVELIDSSSAKVRSIHHGTAAASTKKKENQTTHQVTGSSIDRREMRILPPILFKIYWQFPISQLYMKYLFFNHKLKNVKMKISWFLVRLMYEKLQKQYLILDSKQLLL